ncbi:hypothetical protein ACIQU6_20965 [Streptomyces sp. NPDC090442]|uniref:hypothetical protein n=1 Tax=Streptomyces sp. NPDC090442 TaxID=3365962 RepID=UPI0038218C6F
MLLITRLAPGASLFKVVNSIGRDQAGRQLARFLAALHDPSAGERAQAAVGKLTNTQLPPATTTAPERVVAWHLRIALGDALWRSEAGIPLPDRRTPSQWVDGLSARFTALDIAPETPPQLPSRT